MQFFDPLSDPLTDPLTDRRSRTYWTLFERQGGYSGRNNLQRHLHKMAHFLRRFLLHLRGDVSVGVQRKPRGKMPKRVGQCFDVHAVLQRNRCESMP